MWRLRNDVSRRRAGLAVPVAARLANIAAGIVVGKVGTAVARESDLLEALTPERGALRKVMGRAEVVEQAERWRRRGWRIGFTNGCFDLLHPGHVHLLEQARGWCDRLVVGLNSDASVKRLKGPTRPIQGEFGVALVLGPEKGLAALDVELAHGAETRLDDEELEKLRLGNPAARSLPLLAALARGAAAEVVLSYVAGGSLRVRVEPC